MDDAVPAPIKPDDQDWTWVLIKPCSDCGFSATEVERSEVGSTIRSIGKKWHAVLNGAGETANRRPSPEVWSVLEYGAHVRDVFLKFDERLVSMLTEDDPLFANWDQDETAVAKRYHLQNPTRVAAQLSEAAMTLADRFNSVSYEEWDRPGRRSDGTIFTIDSFARYLLHDPIHHLWDVE